MGMYRVWGLRFRIWGSRDLVTTYNWAYNPTYGLIGVTPIINRVLLSVISNC